MNVYWLTFRLADDATYSTRYDDLVSAIDKLSPGWWVEPTAFLLFQSKSSIDQVASAVKLVIDPKKDLVLVGMPNVKSARLIGQADHFESLEAMMPFVKKA